MEIVFALLAHGAPGLVERLVRTLVSEGHKVALHYDLKSPPGEYQRLVQTFGDCGSVCFAERVKVRWAEWSIVEAALNCVDAIQAAGWQPDYVYHLSGMDYPIRPSCDLVGFLERNKGTEFIEGVPAETGCWAKTGLQTERYEYRFYFNWRDQRRRFDWSLRLQQKLGLKRKFVRGLVPYMGSQWWVLTWDTLRRVRALAREPDILRFFRTTLVPDELFFQTLVRHLVPEERVVSRTLTLYQFTDYGWPVVYYTDHADYLLRQPFFMARKMSPRHTALRDALDACWHGETPSQRFEDAAVGVVSREYEERRQTYRDGPPGKPVAGRPPRPRYGDLGRLVDPFFIVIGSSTAELRLAYQALGRNPALLCHGQLFHPKRVEFSEKRSTVAGYGATDMKLRGVSVPNFVADIVRAEKQRLPGFLLRWGQARRLVEVLFQRPNARIVLLRGDPLIAFGEEMLGVEPLLADDDDRAVLDAIEPAALAERLQPFLNDFRNYGDWLSERAGLAACLQPVTEIELVGDMPRFSRWLPQLEAGLGLKAPTRPEFGAGRELSEEVARLRAQRALVLDRLLASETDAAAEHAPQPAFDRLSAA